MTTDYFDPTSLKLGAQEAPPDPRTARLTDFLVPAELPTRPQVYSNAPTVNPWEMLGNDSKGDCVVAGWTHLLMLWSQLAGSPIRPTAAQVVDLYLQLTGGQDVGLVIRKFLSFVRGNAALGGKKLLGYAALDPRDPEEMRIATYLFHGVMRGLLLPKTAQSQTGPSNRWTALNLNDPNAAPASWGAHLTMDVGFTPDYMQTITWGMVQPVDPSFYPAYSMEAYACIPTWDVPGFDRRKFADYLRTISTDVDIDPVAPDPAPPTPERETDYEALLRILGQVSQITVNVDVARGRAAAAIDFTKSQRWFFPIGGAQAPDGFQLPNPSNSVAQNEQPS